MDYGLILCIMAVIAISVGGITIHIRKYLNAQKPATLSDLRISTYEYSGTYKVSVVDILKQRDKEDLYIIELNPLNATSWQTVTCRVPKSIYDEKIGDGYNTIDCSFYKMNVGCPRFLNAFYNYVEGYDISFCRNSINGEEPFSKENASDLVVKALDVINYSITDRSSYNCVIDYHAPIVDWYRNGAGK